MSKLIENSALPTDYVSSLSSWISALSVETESQTTGTTQTKPTSGATQTKTPSTSSTTASTSTPSYAKGRCSFHLDEWWDCDVPTSNLYATLKLLDNNKNVIGQTNNPPSVLGVSINANNPLSLDSKLPHPLVITGEHEGDYVQFTYGSVSWNTTTPSDGGNCNTGGWNPRGGPACDGGKAGILTNSERQMDCSFPC